ncbi:MAG TPA: methylated-DNA--[protein]-cysteine S-methyltransferase [Candidatus Binatia bacterium]|nr:methylated-DNA--[protein]-cysteine S-methyltransferase [Candidatus Binatia bacterium]
MSNHTEPLAIGALETPHGTMHVATSARGVCRIELPVARAARRFERWLRTAGRETVNVSPLLARTLRELQAYFAGGLRRFTVPLDLAGTEFQQRVWRTVASVPFGSTTSYGAVARAIGEPGKARAVGAANGANPVPIIVPCHRIIGADGSLTGYGGGLPLKLWLLRHEGALIA